MELVVAVVGVIFWADQGRGRRGEEEEEEEERAVVPGVQVSLFDECSCEEDK